MNNKIFVVDGDNTVISALESSLLERGYSLTGCSTGRDALAGILAYDPDLVLLEVELSDTDGYTLCKELRERGYHKPIIFLSDDASAVEVVFGLEAGVQDFIRKPLFMNELIARVESHLKNKERNTIIQVNNIEIDLERRKVTYKGRNKYLSQKEFQLLHALAQTPNKVFSRDELLSDVWGWATITKTRTVDIHMGYLRKKFEEDTKRPTMFQTIRGIGYTLNVE